MESYSGSRVESRGRSHEAPHRGHAIHHPQNKIMKILILSDTHLEFHLDEGEEYINSLPTKNIDGVVLAGDICDYIQLQDILSRFCNRYNKVIYLWGNHEAYGTTINRVREIAWKAKDKNDNLTILDNNRIEVFDDVFFIGGTMWFRNDEDNFRYEYFMNDFHRIKNLRDVVYKENENTVSFLRNNIQKEDVVVTHHLPSTMSIHPNFEGHDLNRFFLCDVEDIIKEQQPKLWVHGHTHHSFDYTIFATKVLCNPLGYPHELNSEYKELVVEV